MINTHLNFEAKVPNGSKMFAFTRNYSKYLSLKANLTLKVKNFCIHKELHKIFKFKGQFDLEGQGQGHQFLNTSEILR